MSSHLMNRVAITVVSASVLLVSALSFQPLAMQSASANTGASNGTGAKPNLPYGRYTCKQGYVWREAYVKDVVCVRPSVRERAHYDNAHAAQRIQPGGGAYGPGTCKQGFVWRQAIPSDHVCVKPQTRTETATENSQASKHRVIP